MSYQTDLLAPAIFPIACASELQMTKSDGNTDQKHHRREQERVRARSELRRIASRRWKNRPANRRWRPCLYRLGAL